MKSQLSDFLLLFFQFSVQGLDELSNQIIADLTLEILYYYNPVIWNRRLHFCFRWAERDISKNKLRRSPQELQGLFFLCLAQLLNSSNLLSNKSKPCRSVQIPTIEPVGHLHFYKMSVENMSKTIGFFSHLHVLYRSKLTIHEKKDPF